MSHLRVCYGALFGLSVLVLVSIADEAGFCSWSPRRQLRCQDGEFSCLTVDKCIPRRYYCDRDNDCGDNSDEAYCGSSTCPEDFTSCGAWSNKCIPNEWICNGETDCSDGSDENNCKSSIRVQSNPTLLARQSWTAVNKLKEWVRDQKNNLSSTEKWGSNVDRLASILYHVAGKFNASMVYEMKIHLLSRLSSTKLEDIPSTELASYVSALSIVSINSRNFHGYNFIQELRNRVDQENYTNPNVLLTLCNAGEAITQSDQRKLIDAFENKHREIWTGIQAVAVMALACASKQPGNEVDAKKLQVMTLELKQQQGTDGIVINLPTTALVLQALMATDSESDPDTFDEKKAFQALLNSQESDGSFGDIASTFLVAPVLSCKSLLDINSDLSEYAKEDEMNALENLSRRKGTKIRVQYSLWIGNEKNLERNLVLRVPQNTSLYDIMGIAAEIDSLFQLDYTMEDSKPYISSLSGLRDDPFKGKFWFLYVVQNEEPSLLDKSPADIIPSDNDHYAMWYRRGSWVDASSED